VAYFTVLTMAMTQNVQLIGSNCERGQSTDAANVEVQRHTRKRVSILAFECRTISIPEPEDLCSPPTQTIPDSCSQKASFSVAMQPRCRLDQANDSWGDQSSEQIVHVSVVWKYECPES